MHESSRTVRPSIASRTQHFIFEFLFRFRWQFSLMLLFEGVHAMSNMLIPYATGKIIQSIYQSGSVDIATTFVAAYPLTLFAFLCAVELLSSRLSGAVQARLGPVQRVFVTRSLYAHLQRH